MNGSNQMMVCNGANPTAIQSVTKSNQCSTTARVTEFTLKWPKSDDIKREQRIAHAKRFMPHCHSGDGSTHELVFDGSGYMWISGQAYNQIARVAYDGSATFFELPEGSAPHGLTLDLTGHLWIGLQGRGELVRVNIKHGFKIVETVDVNIYLHKENGDQRINTQPHGVGLDKDGLVWFTGKQTSSVGRISNKVDKHRKVSHFPLQTTNAVPIYIAAGPDGNMWCTELYGNAIARISPKGVVTEYPIPTPNSRPIAIAVSPDRQSMWFTQEAGANVGRIDMHGNITEFRIPMAEREAVLAALAFDHYGNFWVQQYVIPPKSGKTANDYIVKVGSDLLNAKSNSLTDVDVTFYQTPSQGTVLHRIVQAPDADGTIWFTEMGLDKIGCINLNQE